MILQESIKVKIIFIINFANSTSDQLLNKVINIFQF